MLRAGDVVVLFDGTIRPPKHKWFLCVSPANGWFLRINTKEIFRPCFALRAREDPCIEHDCFIELRGRIEFDRYDIDESLKYPANHKGRLTDRTLRRLVEHLPQAPTLTPEEMELMLAELRAVLGQPSR
jgi:hypothetical protein